MTTLHLDRDSVAAGDDFSSHKTNVAVGAIESVEDLQIAITRVAEKYLPHVSGPATWVAWSKIPLVLISNNEKGRTFFVGDWKEVNRVDGGFEVRFVYYGTANARDIYTIIQKGIGSEVY